MSKLKKIKTEIEGVYIIESGIFEDSRGFFFEMYNQNSFSEIGISQKFVQDNYSLSKKYVLRGLHFQSVFPQAKLIRVISGSIFNVILDLRKNSQTFGKTFGIELNSKNRRALFVPDNFANGFLSLEENTEVLYKCSDFYMPEYESGILWNDSDLKINWRLQEYGIQSEDILISEKDRKNQLFREYIRGIR